MTGFADGGVVRWTPGLLKPLHFDNGHVMRKPEWAGRVLTGFKWVDPAAERAAAVEMAIRATEAVFSDPRVPGWIAHLEADAREDVARWESEGGAVA